MRNLVQQQLQTVEQVLAWVGTTMLQDVTTQKHSLT